jgi:tripartite-type tricarboxylate transporter receptor subunit TctC
MLRRIAASGMFLFSVGAIAQPAYPTRLVRLVVPFSPGGATDVPARILGQKLTSALGQQVLVDNRPGAGGTIGADIVAKSPADGHTLLLTATTHVISAGLYRKLSYDAINDFAPITKIASAPNVLVIHPSVPAKSVRELVALTASRSGSIDFASSGNGSSQHLFGALFMSMAKIKMNHIPYKGSAQATTDLVSGQVSVGFPGIAIALPQKKAGRMRSLAVTSGVRSSAMPEIPTISEAGVKGYEATLWLGLLAPKKHSSRAH